MTTDPETVLRTVFGHGDFRGHQREIITHVCAGRDAVALMPTGAGKSLCYQIPALCRDGTALVISPLVALMRTQVRALRDRGVRAGLLEAGQCGDATAALFRAMREGALDILYVAPERAASPRFVEAMTGHRLALIAVDEAHCISQWGHEFRPAYQALDALLASHPHCPRLALTGTADHRTLSDIRTHLWMTHAQLFKAGFARPNIALNVIPGGAARTGAIERLLRDQFACAGPQTGSAIVYCRSRAGVERLTRRLRRAQLPALAYHAGLERPDRTAIEERFAQATQEGLIIVATVAFGMGLDRTDIRQVIHADPPASLEAYWQEVGRAGRDGAPATATLACGTGEMIALRRSTARDASPGESLRLQAMLGFLETPGCRARAVLDYFADPEPEPCGQCDRCRTPVERADGSDDMLRVLRTLQETGGRCGPKRLCERLVTTHGGSVVRWQSLQRQALARGLLDPADDTTSALTASPEGLAFARTPRPLMVLKDWEEASLSPRQHIQAAPPGNAIGDLSRQLDRLRAIRARIAEEHGLPPMMICHDRALETIATQRPACLEELKAVPGLGPRKVERFGPALLQALSA